jgi:hypothetical protein
VSEAVSGILRRLDRKHKITVLRFFGHGTPGLQAVGGDEAPDQDQCIGYVDGGPGFLGGSQLLHLRAHFARATLWRSPRIELHGCEVAKGTEGDNLLFTLCNLLEVRVLGNLLPQSKNAAYAFASRSINVGDDQPE